MHAALAGLRAQVVQLHGKLAAVQPGAAYIDALQV